MEFSCDTALKIKFEFLPLPDFSIYIRNGYVKLLTTSHRRITTFWHNTHV
jgi:hypothetical protein